MSHKIVSRIAPDNSHVRLWLAVGEGDRLLFLDMPSSGNNAFECAPDATGRYSCGGFIDIF
jgi:hypothetical protein